MVTIHETYLKSQTPHSEDFPRHNRPTHKTRSPPTPATTNVRKDAEREGQSVVVPRGRRASKDESQQSTLRDRKIK
ncbi:hypothetical protein J6590_071755 [Homalodisca vitripennis]|nr:hypothetical protein J6590_071755 [Homalodisca vitripennis]